MSFWLEDSNGYLGDFASCGGMRELHGLSRDKFPHLQAFLDGGQADSDAVDAIEKECKNHPVTDYISRMMHDAHAPVILTDGTPTEDHHVPEDDEELDKLVPNDEIPAEAKNHV